MINIYLKPDERLVSDVDEAKLKQIDRDALLWVEVNMPSERDRRLIKEVVDVDLLTREEAQEIESTSKYSETESGVVANLNFIEPENTGFRVEPLSFVITNDGTLVSVRHANCDLFQETTRRLAIDRTPGLHGSDIFLTLVEAHVDREADMMEMVAGKITGLSKQISGSESIGKDTIKLISSLQEQIITLRENIFDLQRVLFSIQRSSRFKDTIRPRLELILKDIDSLINHADFSFQRLDSLQDTALGLINIEQNEIVKILSVAAVVFMPPTLVASIYGMNFKYMPELDWEIQLSNGILLPMGYIFAIFLMLCFAFLTVWYFKYKKWL